MIERDRKVDIDRKREKGRAIDDRKRDDRERDTKI